MKSFLALSALVFLCLAVGGAVWLLLDGSDPVKSDDQTEEAIAINQEVVEEIPSVQDQPVQAQKVNCDVAVPNDDLVLYTSQDGLELVKQGALFSRASVPNLLFDQDAGDFILAFQSFENLSTLCDRMAYVRLATDGTVSDISPLIVKSSTYLNGFDPTLVSVQGKLVLVYTVRPPGKTHPCISLASANGDDVSDGFTNLDQILWCSDGDSENYMDASAVVVGDELFVYIPSDAAMASGHPSSYFAKVDVASTNSEDWELTQTGAIDDAQLFLLGEMMAQPESNSCPYAFYGTYQNTVRRACSLDGLIFDSDTQVILSQAADPGVARKPDGGYFLVVSQ